MIVAGITGIGIYYLMENIALTLTQASNISVIVSIAPIFTGILAHFFLEGEKMKKSIVLGFVCAMAGICLITELLEPEFGSLYVTPPDIDERVRQLSFTISEGIHRALF